MPKVSRELVFKVPMNDLWQAIVNVESYDQFLPEVKASQIVEKLDNSQFTAEFQLEIIKRFHYQLKFVAVETEKKKELSWKLKKSDLFKINQGHWSLSELSSHETKVHYQSEIELGFLVPKWVLNKLVDVQLPQMFEKFEKQAKSMVSTTT